MMDFEKPEILILQHNNEPKRDINSSIILLIFSFPILFRVKMRIRFFYRSAVTDVTYFTIAFWKRNNLRCAGNSEGFPNSHWRGYGGGAVDVGVEQIGDTKNTIVYDCPKENECYTNRNAICCKIAATPLTQSSKIQIALSIIGSLAFWFKSILGKWYLLALLHSCCNYIR